MNSNPIRGNHLSYVPLRVSQCIWSEMKTETFERGTTLVMESPVKEESDVKQIELDIEFCNGKTSPLIKNAIILFSFLENWENYRITRWASILLARSFQVQGKYFGWRATDKNNTNFNWR